MITSPNALLSDMEGQADRPKPHLGGRVRTERQAGPTLRIPASEQCHPSPGCSAPAPRGGSVTEKEGETWSLGEEEMELGVILREAVREDLTGRRTFEQRSERSDRLSHTGAGRVSCWGASAHAPGSAALTSAAVPLRRRQSDLATGAWAAPLRQGLF